MAVNNDDATKQIFSRCLLTCLQVPLWYALLPSLFIQDLSVSLLLQLQCKFAFHLLGYNSKHLNFLGNVTFGSSERFMIRRELRVKRRPQRLSSLHLIILVTLLAFISNDTSKEHMKWSLLHHPMHIATIGSSRFASIQSSRFGLTCQHIR